MSLMAGPMAGTSWTRNEVSAFLKLRPHDLIPLLHSGSWPPQSLHVECSHIEEIKLSEGFEQAMDKLGAVITKRSNTPPELKPEDYPEEDPPDYSGPDYSPVPEMLKVHLPNRPRQLDIDPERWGIRVGQFKAFLGVVFCKGMSRWNVVCGGIPVKPKQNKEKLIPGGVVFRHLISKPLNKDTSFTGKLSLPDGI